jgi:hypothetical protein
MQVFALTSFLYRLDLAWTPDIVAKRRVTIAVRLPAAT